MEGSGPQPKGWKGGFCGFLKLEWDSLLLLPEPCLGAYFPSVFHFSSMECGRSRSHSIPFLFPRCFWIFFFDFFVLIHVELLEWLPAHTVLFHISETLPVVSRPPPPDSPSNTHFSWKTFTCLLGHYPGLFLQGAYSFLALCKVKFTREIVCVCLHHGNIRYWGAEVPAEASLFS